MFIQYKANGMRREVRDLVAKSLVRRGLATKVDVAGDAPLRERAAPATAAPYGYKADGTPRSRPGRKPAEKPSEKPADAGTYQRRDLRAEGEG